MTWTSPLKGDITKENMGKADRTVVYFLFIF